MRVNKQEKEIVLKLDRNVTKIKLTGKYTENSPVLKCDTSLPSTQTIQPEQSVTIGPMFEIY